MGDALNNGKPRGGGGGSGRARFEAINGPPPGKFIETEHGTTHYVLEGPIEGDGPLVVLQHGLAGNVFVYDRIASDLVGAGCRVLRLDFYDRGYSETDPVRYPIGENDGSPHPLDFTLDVYVEQFREVLTKLGLVDRDLIYCGHSNGGVTGIGYAAKHPEHVKGLCLIGPVCLPVSKPLAARIADLPIVGPLVVKLLGHSTMIEFSRNSCHNPDGVPAVQDFLEKLARNVRENERYFASIRSTNGKCKGFVGSAEQEFRQCCQSKIPLHLMWGKADASVPYSQCLALRKIATAEGLVEEVVSESSFEGMPHNIFFEDAKPEECSRSIRDFVAKINGMT